MKTEKKYKLRDRYHGKRVPYAYWGEPDKMWYSPVPAAYRRADNKVRRSRNKMALVKLMQGKEDQPFVRERRDVRWNYY